jgi:hypothetical protein
LTEEAVEPAAGAASARDAADRSSGGGRRRESDRDPAEEAPLRKARAGRPYAPLVAQVIATALGLAQTRARRRGTVAEAEALYRRPVATPKPPRGSA